MQSIPSQNGPYNRQTKVSLAILVLGGFFVLLYGWTKIGEGIKAPYTSASKGENAVITQTATAEQFSQVDTDKDGLADYEEQDFYGTSPYLADSDNDGITDYQEIIGGTDPLCPEGTTCATTGVSSNAAANNASHNIGTNTSTVLVDPLQYPSVSNINREGATLADRLNAPISVSDLEGVASMEEIRSFLVDTAGVDEATLNKLSDADVQELFVQSIQTLQDAGYFDDATNTSGTTPSSAPPAAPTTATQDLTGQEIRNQLLEAGLTEADIKGFSDDDLKQILLETL